MEWTGLLTLRESLYLLTDPSAYAFDPQALLNFLSAVAIAGCALFVWMTGARERTSRMYFWSCWAFVYWQAGRGLMRMLVDPDRVPLLSQFLYAGIAIGVACLFHFILLMMREATKRALAVRLNWVVGLLFAVLSLFSPWMVVGHYTTPWGTEPLQGVAGTALFLWVGVLVIYCSVALIRRYRAAHVASTERARLRNFGVGLLALYTASFDFLAASGYVVYPVGFFSAMAFSLVTARMAFRYGLIDVTPQLAANELIDMVPNALVLTDRDGVVQVVNERMRDLLSDLNKAVRGKRAETIFGQVFSPESLLRLSNYEDAAAEQRFTFGGPGGLAELALSVRQVVDNDGRTMAFVCSLRDVTSEQTEAMRNIREELTDALTDIPGRSFFLELVDQSIRRANRDESYTFAALLVGLDRFRNINEDLGPAAGDRILMEVAQRLAAALPSNDILTRVGGDEFAVLAHGEARGVNVVDYVDRINAALQAPFMTESNAVYCTASIGVTVSGHDFLSSDELLRSLGMAMYRSKSAGGGCQYILEAHDTPQHRTRLDADLRAAIEHREFVVLYHPIVDVETCRVAGLEALIRWQHPQRGLLSPAEFVDYAEESGLIVPIGRWLMNQVCRDLSELRRFDGYRDLFCSINVSDAEYASGDLVTLTLECLRQSELPTSALRLELTERIVMRDPNSDLLRELDDLGLGLWVDDFGTGYSSLSRLHDQPLQTIKIDRSFIRAMVLSETGDAIVRSIILLATNLHMNIIAEGVETEEEGSHALAHDCRFIQGFYFAQPVPLAALRGMLENHDWIEQRVERLQELRQAS